MKQTHYIKTLKSSTSGFSLVELMVVLAVIGLLAAIGIPMYSKFRLKAISVEAKTSLSNLYVAEAAFFLEFNAYHSSFDVIGFTPPARSRYNIGFGSAGSPAGTTEGYNGSLSATQIANTNSKAVCSGYGTGTTNTCNLIANAPNLPSQLTVIGTSFAAGALTAQDVAYEKYETEESAHSSLAYLLLMSNQAFARALGGGAAGDPDPSGLPYSFSTEDSTNSLSDSWSIDQTKTIRHSLPGPSGSVCAANHTLGMPSCPGGEIISTTTRDANGCSSTTYSCAVGAN